jgi:hypothetical protein
LYFRASYSDGFIRRAPFWSPKTNSGPSGPYSYLIYLHSHLIRFHHAITLIVSTMSSLNNLPFSPNLPQDREEQPIHYVAPTMQTPYMVMSVQANEASKLHNFLAAMYSWITLAGYIVLPGTFTSLTKSDSLHNSNSGKVVQKAVQNVPLLPLAGLCFLGGTIGSCYLWRKWWKNYIWLVGRIFL